MAKLVIEGGKPLRGEIDVCGAKNAALPILAATVLCGGVCRIHNCPRLSDVDAAMKILTHLGCTCAREDGCVVVDSSAVTSCEIPDDLMREMRSSIVFLGAIAGRCREARLSFPGGCELGPRPIDLHLQALRVLGLQIDEAHGGLDCHTDGLKGCEITLSIPSVGATENILLASSVAKGKTVIRNAALLRKSATSPIFSTAPVPEFRAPVPRILKLKGCRGCIRPHTRSFPTASSPRPIWRRLQRPAAGFG